MALFLVGSAAGTQQIIQTFELEQYGKVELAPDLDGDGHWDLVLANVGYKVPPLKEVGRVWAISGATGATLFEHVGDTEYAWLGLDIELLDDLDGDGIVEIVAIGSSKLFVWSGADGSEIFQGSVGGATIARLGDATGNGIEDFVVGRPFPYSGGEVHFNEGGTFATMYVQEEPPFWNTFGSATVGLDDVNGDGIPDFAVGAPGLWNWEGDCTVGHVGVYSGGDGTLLYGLSGEAPQSQFGSRLAAPGDITGDGVGDLVVASPGCCDAFFFCWMANGRIYFFDGLDGSLVDTLDSPDGWGNLFGSIMTSAEDLNGNGWPDILVLEPSSSLLPATTYMIDGGTREVIYSVENPYPDSGYGYWPLAGLDDLDGDDFPDFLAGVSWNLVPSTPSLLHLWSGAPVGVKAFGQPCPTAAGDLPRIGATGSAALGTNWKVHLSRVAPDLPALLAVGTSSASWAGVPLPLALGALGMPGCELLVAPSQVFPAVTEPVGPGQGAATVSLRMPQDGALLGAVFYAQWAVLNPPGSPSPAAVTRGLEVSLLVAPGADLPPVIDAITPAAIPILVPGTEQTVSITGSGFSPSTAVSVDGIDLTGSPSAFTVVSPELITLDMPQLDHLGPVEIRVSNTSGWAVGEIVVVAPETPQLQTGSGDELIPLSLSQPLEVLMSSLPNDLFLLYWSPSGLPSTLPGLVELEIGNGFASLVHAGSFVIDPTTALAKLDAGSVFGVVPLFGQLYLEGIVIRATGFALPLDTSNRQHVIFLF